MNLLEKIMPTKCIVVDCGECYDSYDIYIQAYAPGYISLFTRGKLPSKGMSAIILYKGIHTLSPDKLYIIQDLETRHVYVIGVNGVQLLK